MGWPLVLVLTAVLGADVGADLGDDEQPDVGPLSTPAAAPSRLKATDAFVVAKNIFLPLQPTGPVVIPQSQPVLQGNLTLTGVIQEEDGRFVALIEDRGQKKSIFLAVGEELGPWKAEQIDMSHLVLKNKDGASQTVELGTTFAAALLPAPGEVRPGVPGGSPSTGAVEAAPSSDTGTRTIEDILRERRRREGRRL